MADVTLTQDTLWSDIKDTATDDGDTVDLNGYTLTIDESVVPQIKWTNGSLGECTVHVSPASSDVLEVNCYDYYYNGTLPRANLIVDGSLMDIGTVEDVDDGNGGTVQQASVLKIGSMPTIDGVYIKELGVWLFNRDFYASNVDDEDYSAYTQKPVFTYDDSAGTITFDFYPVPAGSTVQHPQVIIHYRGYSVSSTDWYLGGQRPQKRHEVRGAYVYRPTRFEQSQTVRSVAQGNPEYTRIVSDSLVCRSGSGYQTYYNLVSTNCGWFEPNDSNGCLRLQMTSGCRWVGCTFYPRFADNGGNENNLFDGCNIFGNAGNIATFGPDNEYRNCRTVCAVTRMTVGSGFKFSNTVFEGTKNPDAPWYRKDSFSGTTAKKARFCGCRWEGGFYNAIVASYYGWSDLRVVDCTFDSSGSSGNGSALYPGDNDNIHVVNMRVIPEDGGGQSWGRFSNGVTYSTSNWLIGYRGPNIGYLDAAWMLVLDFLPDGKDLFDVENYYDYFGTHYSQDSDRYEIVVCGRGDSTEWFAETGGKFRKDGGYFVFTDIGDYVVLNATNGYNFMYYEIDRLLDGFELYYGSYLSDLSVSVSMDGGDTWHASDALDGLQSKKPFSMLVRIEKTDGDGHDSKVRFLLFPFQRVSGFEKYPNYALWHTAKMTQLSEFGTRLNCALFTESEGYMGRTVSDGASAGIETLYHETDERYTIKARKYGCTFEECGATAADEYVIRSFYTGGRKTDLTMTEADAAAITGITLQPSSDADYTWELDCGGKSLEDAYHHCQYRLTNFGEWAGINTFEFSEFLQRDGEMYKTIQARDGEGVKLVDYTGKVSGMTKDDGSVYKPPVDVIMTIHNVVVGSSVYIHTTDDDTEIYKGTADSDTVSASISGLSDKPYEVVIRKASSDPRYVEWTATGTIGTVDIDITANQQEM